MPTYVLHEPRSPFVIVLLVSISAWKPHPCFVCVCMRKTQPFIGPCPSIDCGCRLQECYPCRILASHVIAVVQSTSIRSFQSHSHFFEAHPGACKLVEATYSTMQHGICSTPTNLSIYLLVIAGICMATYLKYANSTNSNKHLHHCRFQLSGSHPGLLSGFDPD